MQFPLLMYADTTTVIFFAGAPSTDTESSIADEDTLETSIPASASSSTPGGSTKENTASTSYESELKWFLKYRVPWNKFPNSFTIACDSGKYPDKSALNDMIRLLMENILSVCKERPSRTELRAVVFKIVAKYPQLKAKVGTTVIGDGTSTLLSKLEARRDNAMRKSSKWRKRNANEDDDQTDHKPSRAECKDAYGCIVTMVNPPLPDAETTESQDEKLKQLRNLFVEQPWDNNDINPLMIDTYPTQRFMIKEGKTVTEIVNQCPFLAEKEWLLQHFMMLTGLKQTVLEMVPAKSLKLYQYWMAQEKKSKAMEAVLSDIAREKDIVKNNSPIINGLLTMLSCHFKEDISVLVRCYKVGANLKSLLQFI